MLIPSGPEQGAWGPTVDHEPELISCQARIHASSELGRATVAVPPKNILFYLGKRVPKGPYLPPLLVSPQSYPRSNPCHCHGDNSFLAYLFCVAANEVACASKPENNKFMFLIFRIKNTISYKSMTYIFNLPGRERARVSYKTND